MNTNKGTDWSGAHYFYIADTLGALPDLYLVVDVRPRVNHSLKTGSLIVETSGGSQKEKLITAGLLARVLSLLTERFVS